MSICKVHSKKQIFPLLALIILLAPIDASLADTAIDEFSTNQASLSLTFPPAGTNTSSQVSGAGVLGGERDLAVALSAGVIAGNALSSTVSSGFLSYSQDATIAGSGTLQWDGIDGSAALNSTGLGGVDLGASGSQDAIQVSLAFDDLPTNISMVLHTDAGNSSTWSFTLPGLVFTNTNFVVPRTAFSTTTGAGANFSNVGAIVFTLGSNVTAPDVVIDRIAAVSLLNASMTVAFLIDANSNSIANSGDTLRYTLIVQNPDDAFDAIAQAVQATTPPDANTTLVVGSVTSTQGTVTQGNTAGDTLAQVSIGDIADGGSVTITFDVVVNNSLPGGVTQIASQSVVTSSTLTNLRSDDPGVGGTVDPTVVPADSMPVTLQSFSVD